jgi:endonuclease/exonuclease/phosphatase family metal-dependent hydrolase
MKIVTYNIQTLLNDDPGRIIRIIDEIKTTNAVAICLQEVSTPHMRNHLIDLLSNEYHMIFSHNYGYGKLRVYSFIPTVVFAILSIFSTIHLRFLLQFAAACFFPYLTLHVLGVFNDHFRLGAEGRIDRQGLCIMVRKDDFGPISLIDCGVFSSPGYACEMSMVGWFLFTFLRPGYLFVSTVENKTGDKIVLCNAHFALEGDYWGRLSQANELISLSHEYVKTYSDGVCFIGCDMNSCDDIAFETMNENLCNLTHDVGVITWDCSNPRTKSVLWDEKSHILSRQIDYIWCNRISVKTVDVRLIGNKQDQDLSDHYGLFVELNLLG